MPVWVQNLKKVLNFLKKYYVGKTLIFMEKFSKKNFFFRIWLKKISFNIPAKDFLKTFRKNFFMEIAEIVERF